MKKPSALLVASLLILCLFLLSGCGPHVPEESSFSRTEQESTPAELSSGPEDRSEDLLDIRFTVPETVSGGREEIVDLRRGSISPGLNRFCPTTTFEVGNYESVRNIYLDVLVQEKNARVGENYSDMTDFRYATGLETMVTENYVSISDYYERNFSKAEQGEDTAYSSFQRLDDTTIGGTAAYHFTYERPAPGPGEPLQTEGGTDLIYERYGEQYLFETERYIYAFALSEQGENPLASKLLQKMVDSIQIKTTGILEPPVNDDNEFLEFPSDAVGTPPERYTSGS